MEIRDNSVGYCACPVCGENVDVRVNKNFKLYLICDNSHRVEFSAKDSFKARPLLSAGAVATCANITIYPLNSTTKKEIKKDGEKTTTTTTTRGSEPQPTNRNIGVATSRGSEPREQSRGNSSTSGRDNRNNDEWGFFG